MDPTPSHHWEVATTKADSQGWKRRDQRSVKLRQGELVLSIQQVLRTWPFPFHSPVLLQKSSENRLAPPQTARYLPGMGTEYRGLASIPWTGDPKGRWGGASSQGERGNASLQGTEPEPLASDGPPWSVLKVVPVSRASCRQRGERESRLSSSSHRSLPPSCLPSPPALNSTKKLRQFTRKHARNQNHNQQKKRRNKIIRPCGPTRLPGSVVV